MDVYFLEICGLCAFEANIWESLECGTRVYFYKKHNDILSGRECLDVE